MIRLDRSELHALAFHIAFAVAAAGTLAMPVATLGTRIWALVLGYNLALPVAARALGHREWLTLWLFLVPVSALQVFPDWVLSAVLGVLVFPDTGGPRIDTVSASMAGMWTIALFPIVYVGLRVEERRGQTAAMIAVAVASLVVLVGSEAISWRIPIWYARDVAMLGHVALYVVIPEIVLGVATFRVFTATVERSLGWRLAGALGLMLFYLGALMASYHLFEG